VDAQGKHIRLGAAAGLVDGLGTLKVRPGAVNRLPRDLQVFLRQRDAEIGAQHIQGDVRVASARILAGDVAREARFLDTAASSPRIEYYLLNRQLRLVVIHSIRAIQRADREICITELVLGEKGAEYEHGVVAALEALRELQPRQIAGVGLVNASLRFSFPGIRSGGKRIRV